MPLKRSSAPSQNGGLFKRPKSDDSEDSPSPSSASFTHADICSFLRKDSRKDDEEAEAEQPALTPSRGKENQPVNVGKNVAMAPGSAPLFFAASFKSPFKTRDSATGLEYGLVHVLYDEVVLYNQAGKKLSGKRLTRTNLSSGQQQVLLDRKEVVFSEGSSFYYSNKIVQLYEEVPESAFTSGSFFMQEAKDRSGPLVKIAAKQEKPTIRLAAARKPTGFTPPFKGANTNARRNLQPLFSPHAQGAFVLFQPTNLFSENKIAVVVDPVLANALRPHQRDGVQFLFDCVGMGFLDKTVTPPKKYFGAILADDMGLGKSIQAIALLWTLLRQGPTGDPCARKALIVCPTSLVGNWQNEIKKWLGDRLGVLAIGESTKKSSGVFSKLQFEDCDVLVISYDQMKIHDDALAKIWNIDLVIADEGHKLKNNKIKTSESLRKIKAKRRVILSGTPIQNDLGEFFAMVDYVNPGILGTEAAFMSVYERPLLALREPEASEDLKELGKLRSKALTQKTERFILRRTQIINSKYLPAKVEFNVFCRLTPLQLSIYQALCTSFRERATRADDAVMGALPLITCLKKLCNSPDLAYAMFQRNQDDHAKMLDLFDASYRPGLIQFSGKVSWLVKLIEHIRATPAKDKLVIVSNYTETLEVLSMILKERNYPFFQLDGKTAVKKRTQLVDIFNQPMTKEFIFLLSSKAGGCGLNIVGANHLVLFDPDWNPANDAQAMARVWRPGQPKTCFLYRVLCTGTIEEKVYQRQISKLALSKSVVGDSGADMDFDAADAMGESAPPTFTPNELKELFMYRGDTICDTHDLLNCRCTLSAVRIPRHKRLQVSVDDLNNWQHFDDVSKIKEDLVRAACDAATVTFVMSKETQPMKLDGPTIKRDHDPEPPAQLDDDDDADFNAEDEEGGEQQLAESEEASESDEEAEEDDGVDDDDE